jgi:hypothetical protein
MLIVSKQRPSIQHLLTHSLLVGALVVAIPTLAQDRDHYR